MVLSLLLPVARRLRVVAVLLRGGTPNGLRLRKSVDGSRRCDDGSLLTRYRWNSSLTLLDRLLERNEARTGRALRRERRAEVRRTVVERLLRLLLERRCGELRWRKVAGELALDGVEDAVLDREARYGFLRLGTAEVVVVDPVGFGVGRRDVKTNDGAELASCEASSAAQPTKQRRVDTHFEGSDERRSSGDNLVPSSLDRSRRNA